MGFPILTFLIGVFNFFIVLYFLAADSVLGIFKKVYIEVDRFEFAEVLSISRFIAAIDCIKKFSKDVNYLSIFSCNAAINYIKKLGKDVDWLIVENIKAIIIKESIAVTANIKLLID